MKFIVLGGYGIIGKAVVADLTRFAKNSEIIVAGRDLKKAREYADSFKNKNIKARQFDIKKQNTLVFLLKDVDVCINCVQYYFNLDIMKACLEARTNYTDLGGMYHMTKKQLKLNNSFKKIGKTAILGIGASPGITNIMAMYGSKFLRSVNSAEITFADADLSKYRQAFVLPYSFKTIVDEYSMKPAVFRNGKTIFTEPHSGEKEYNLGEEFGKKRGFYTLHSELATLPSSLSKKGIKNCEFRVTFPESFNETIEKIIELGFTSKEKIKFSGKKIPIINITSAMMDKLIPNEGTFIKDRELLRIILKGEKEIVIDAITSSDGETSAGVLDTGIPCSIASQMLASGNITEKGVSPPEKAIDFDNFLRELKKRKIKVRMNGEEI